MNPVCIDPGHGGLDPGAVGPYGTEECRVTVDVAMRLKNALHAAGVPSILTHHGFAIDEVKDRDLTLRAKVATDNESPCLVSLHCNASDNWRAHGFEVWTTPGQTKADPLADRIYAAVSTDFPELTLRKDEEHDGDPDKEAWFAVLRRTPVPAVLVEMAFLSNPSEEILLASHHWQGRMATALSRAIQAWKGAVT